MGISRRDYIVRGWRLPFNIEIIQDDKYLPMVEGHRGEKFCIVADDMCGAFTVFGERLASGGDEDMGWEFEIIKDSEVTNEELVDKYVEIFGEIPKMNPQLMIFTVFN